MLRHFSEENTRFSHASSAKQQKIIQIKNKRLELPVVTLIKEFLIKKNRFH